MDNLAQAGYTATFVKAGLTGISGAATTFSTSAFNYALRGIALNNAAVSGGATPTSDFVTGAAITLTANKARSVLWGVDAAGTERVIAGPIVDLDAAGNFVKDAPVLPACPDTVCPFAMTIHKAGATLSGTFTFGSSNWNTTGMTHIVKDLIGLPDRPQTS